MTNTANFGAGPDKTPAENGRALREAIKSLDGRKGTIYLTAGVYDWDCNEPIPDGVSFVGAGKDETIVKQTMNWHYQFGIRRPVGVTEERTFGRDTLLVYIDADATALQKHEDWRPPSYLDLTPRNPDEPRPLKPFPSVVLDKELQGRLVLEILRGPAGATGPPGVMGPQGIQGIQGPYGMPDSYA